MSGPAVIIGGLPPQARPAPAPSPAPTPAAPTLPHFMGLLRQHYNELNRLDLAYAPLLATFQLRQAEAAVAISELHPKKITDPSLKGELGVDDARQLNFLIKDFSKAAQTLDDSRLIFNLHAPLLRSSGGLPDGIQEAITAFKNPGDDSYRDHLKPDTFDNPIDAALRATLLEIYDKARPVRELLAAHDALKKHDFAKHIQAADGVKLLSMNAYLESRLAHPTQQNVIEARNKFDALVPLRRQWGILSDYDKLDPTNATTFGVEKLLNPAQVDIQLQNIVLTSRDGQRNVVLKDKTIEINGDMSVDELKSIMFYSYMQLGKDGLKLHGIQDATFGVRAALACEMLARDTGNADFTKYELQMPPVGTSPATIWRGAALEVGAQRLANSPEFGVLYRAQEATAQRGANLRNITVERLQSEKLLIEEWEKLFIACFPDGDDRESRDQLIERLKNEPDTFFFMSRDAQGKPLGMEMGQLLKQSGTDVSGAVYIPYSATRDGDRNKGVNPAVSEVTDEIYKKAGGTHFLIDVEDSRVFDNDVYKDDVDAKAAELMRGGMAAAAAQTAAKAHVNTTIIEARQNYWRRQGYVMVSDAELPYVRPASSDDQQIQAYDSLIFRVLNDKDAKWKDLYKPGSNKSEISMEAYKRFYLEINRAQYGNLTEAALKTQYPAIKEFLDKWDDLYTNHNKKWVTVRTDPVRASSHPKVEISVTQIESPADSSRPARFTAPKPDQAAQATAA